jgi:hypothetical protein
MLSGFCLLFGDPGQATDPLPATPSHHTPKSRAAIPEIPAQVHFNRANKVNKTLT